MGVGLQVRAHVRDRADGDVVDIGGGLDVGEDLAAARLPQLDDLGVGGDLTRVRVRVRVRVKRRLRVRVRARTRVRVRVRVRVIGLGL